MKKISFVVPAYNEESNISQCIESIIAGAKEYQGETEIIVVDNNSSDATPDIIKKFNVTYIKSFATTPAAVRNEGAALARYEILAFIDGDCILCPNWCQLVNQAYDNPKIGAYGGEYLAPEYDNLVVTAWHPIQLKPVYKLKGKLPGGNFTIRTSLFKKINGFDESLTSAEDDRLSVEVTNLGYHCVLDDKVAVTHRGYPKTLLDVFKKEKWHGKTQIAAHGYFKDKLVLVSYAWLSAFLILFIGVIAQQSEILILGIIGIIICPLIVMLNRLVYHSKISIPNIAMMYLISIFFLAGRTYGLLQEIKYLHGKH